MERHPRQLKRMSTVDPHRKMFVKRNCPVFRLKKLKKGYRKDQNHYEQVFKVVLCHCHDRAEESFEQDNEEQEKNNNQLGDAEQDG